MLLPLLQLLRFLQWDSKKIRIIRGVEPLFFYINLKGEEKIMNTKSKLTILGLVFSAIGAIASFGGNFISDKKSSLELDEKVRKEVKKQINNLSKGE